MEALRDLLLCNTCSLVIRQGGQTELLYGPGLSDLLHLLAGRPEALRNADVADKVVGKAAAALLLCGGVSQVYARLMSRPALKLLQQGGLHPTYEQLTDHILNRTGDGWCPMERIAYPLNSPQEIYNAILEHGPNNKRNAT